MAGGDQATSLVARLESLPFSRWHRAPLLAAFFGIVLEQITGRAPLAGRA